MVALRCPLSALFSSLISPNGVPNHRGTLSASTTLRLSSSFNSVFRVTLTYKNNKLVADLLFQEINNDNDAERMLPSSNLIIVVADIMSRAGLEYASGIIPYAKNFEKKPPVVLVGTKTDLRYEAELWTQDFEKVSRKLDVPFYLVSSKNGDKVAEMMNQILELMLERFYAKKQVSQ